jgi:hypothetical protein
MCHILRKLLTLFGCIRATPKLQFIAEHNGVIYHGVTHMILKKGMMVALAIVALKPNGDPGRIDGAPNWALDNEDGVIELRPAYINDDPEQGVDPMRVWAVAGEAGQVQVSVEADVDLGVGQELVQGFLDVTVPDIEVAVISISAGTPVPAS